LNTSFDGSIPKERNAMSRLAPLTLCFFSTLPLLGCAKSEERLWPVRGQVTLQGKPVTRGAVSFRPLPERGNTSLHQPSAEIDEFGYYTLETGNREGASPGWYKVLVVAQAEDPAGPTKTGMPSPGRSLINKKYANLAATDLMVEVVEQPVPGAYDLKVEK
jgi:hypothetical protein